MCQHLTFMILLPQHRVVMKVFQEILICRFHGQLHLEIFKMLSAIYKEGGIVDLVDVVTAIKTARQLTSLNQKCQILNQNLTLTM